MKILFFLFLLHRLCHLDPYVNLKSILFPRENVIYFHPLSMDIEGICKME